MMVSPNHELAPLIVNSIRKDLFDANENFNCLALHVIANLSSVEVAETLALDIYGILISTSKSQLVRKKAGLCILQIYRKLPDIIPAQLWAESIIELITDPNPVI
jgi:vesicle coat complex subunit